MKRLLTCGLLGIALLTNAQDNSANGGQGQRQKFDMKAMMESRIARYQSQLGFSDDEWSVVSPMLSNIVSKQMTLMRSSFRMGGGRGGRGWRGGQGGQGQGSQAKKDLQKALKGEEIDDAALSSLLSKVRSEKAQKDQELKQSRESLREVLTPRQEAQLVLFGILD